MSAKFKKLSVVLLSVVMLFSVLSSSFVAQASEGINIFDVALDIQLDQTQTATITEGGNLSCFSFTPEYDDVYAFTSSGAESAVTAMLVNVNEEMISLDNAFGITDNFMLAYPMQAGETYYLVAGYYDDSATGTFDVAVSLSPVTDIAFNTTITYTEGNNGNFYCDWNDALGDYDYDKPYYRYEWYKDIEYTITLRDNSKISGKGDSYQYNGEEHFFELYDAQSYDSQWSAGNTYDVGVSTMGFVVEIDVTILSSAKTGWVFEYGEWAYCNENHVKLTNQWVKDSVGWCYVGADGFMVTNDWVVDSVGWCYVGSDGYCVTNSWVYDGYGWCYLDADGHLLTNQWMKDSMGWCYLGDDGYMLTNSWVKDSIGWCFVDENGYMVYDVWVYDGTGICYINSNGYMVSNQWVKDSYGWSYYGADGYLVTNQWMEDSVGWCYVDSTGYMATNKWIQDSQGWCYVGKDGYCIKSAFVRDSVGICYLDKNGRMVTSSWVTVNGRRYYLDADGHVVTGRVVIDGVTYNLLGPFEAFETPTYRPSYY